MTSMRMPLCMVCKHYNEDRTCKAYPAGIPDDIFDEVFIHHKPFPGDHGIQFVPKNESAQRKLERLLRWQQIENQEGSDDV